jgi:hypothetical protein
MGKVVLAILVAFIISFSILTTSLLLYHYKVQDGKWVLIGDTKEVKQIDFYSQKFPANQKNIFIYGSSQVMYMNPIYVRKDLLNNKLDYVVYNVGTQTDLPTTRLNSIDLLIASKPSMVVYGIGDRDFAIDSSSGQNTVILLPNPHNIIIDWLNSQLVNSSKDFFFLNSPKLDFLISTFGSKSVNNIDLLQNHFYGDLNVYAAAESQKFPIATDAQLLSESFDDPNHRILPLENNQNFIAFKKILDRLRENKIGVIVFIVPQERHRLDIITDTSEFNIALKTISQEYPGVPIYSLWDKYADMNIWRDSMHVIMNTKNTTRIYSDDVAKMIIKELEPTILKPHGFQNDPSFPPKFSQAPGGFLNETPLNIYMEDVNVTDGYGTYSSRQINAEYVGPLSVLIGKNIDTIKLHLKKVGSPTGTVTIGVFNPDLSIKKIIATVAVSTIPTSYTAYTFSLPYGKSYQIHSGDRIGIKYSGGNQTNFVAVLADRNNGFDGTNSYYSYYGTSWIALPGSDLTMTLKLVDLSLVAPH